VCSPLVAGCQTRNRAVTGVPRDSVLNKKPVWTQGLGRMGGRQNEFSIDGCNTNGALQSPDAAAHYKA
jgi:hypothetical protein